MFHVNSPEIPDPLLADSFHMLAFESWDTPQHSEVSIRIERAEVAMLVLKRRKGEEIIVNERMRIVVVETSDGSCSLAFDAPESDRIRRAEIPPFEEAVIQRTATAMQVQR